MSELTHLPLAEVVIAVIGSIGSDAGYWVLTPHGLKHVGGWGPEAMREFAAGISAVTAATQIHNGEVSQGIAKTAAPFVNAQVHQVVQTILRDVAAGEHTAAKQAPPVVLIMVNK